MLLESYLTVVSINKSSRITNELTNELTYDY